MRLSLLFPTALWLLLALVPVWLVALAGPRRYGRARLWSVLLLRTALIAGLVLALAGARIERPVESLTTIFLMDRSDSVAPPARARADSFVRAALQTMPEGDRAAVIAFGDGAVVEQAPGDLRDLAAPSGTPIASRTNIQQALELGLSLFPAELNKRLVLLSDGGENAGDSRKATELAAARGVPISYVDLGAAGVKEALVRELEAPAAVRVGQEFTLTVAVESTVAGKGHLRVVDDTGRALFDKDVALKAGANRFAVKSRGAQNGFRRFKAELTAPGDTRPENNRAEALVRVGNAARVLLIDGAPGEAVFLYNALKSTGVQAEAVPAAAAPASLSALSAYDAVVLANVAASALPAGTMNSLPAYVRDMGRGLVMIGGNVSFGVGGYSKTPVEEALPVYMDVRTQRERPNMAILFVLDASSSMSRCHCRGPDRKHDGYYDRNGRYKLDHGKDAVLNAIQALNPRDTVGVVSFNTEASWALKPQAGATMDAVQQAISPLVPRGGTNVGAGLDAAETALAGVNAGVKHVILLTDGWAHTGDPMAAAQRMRQEGITLSVVTEGQGSAPYLEQLASAGGGRYIKFANINDVPQLFFAEVNRMTGNFVIERKFTPAYASHSPVLAGLESGLPPLYGYDGTTLKQTATRVLAGPDGAPVLAQWQYGLGRSIAWTSDAKGAWAKDWVGWKEFPRFAAQLVGWVLPSVQNGNLTAEVHTTGDQTELTVTARDAKGRPRTGATLQAEIAGGDQQGVKLPLEEIAPGSYRARVPTPPEGSYLVQVSDLRNGQAAARTTVGMVVPYAPEYRQLRGDPAKLGALARLTGGGPLAQPKDAFAHTLRGAEQPLDISRPLLYVALALFALDIVARRLLQQAATSGRRA